MAEVFLVGREGVEPPKAKPAGLQPAAFDHSATGPYCVQNFQNNIIFCLIKVNLYFSDIFFQRPHKEKCYKKS